MTPKALFNASRTRPSYTTTTCIFCQTRALTTPLRRIHTSTRRSQQQPSSKPSSPNIPSTTLPATPSRPEPRTRPHIRARDGELVPRPLSRPLGLPHPPQPGQNLGGDPRTWQERRDQFGSYDRHLATRRGLLKDLFEKNYFRDLGNVGKVHKGKSMLAPATPFRRDVAMYFPNLRGRNLRGVDADTTNVLKGRVSVVKIVGTDWADMQCESFVGKGQNEALWELMGQEKETAQLVEVNVESNPLKYWLIRFFSGRLKRIKGEGQWDRYFLVNQGLEDEVKEALGIWNSKVGYVYLLDAQCRVRWAGNGDAREDEKESVVKCLRRLVDEAKGVPRAKVNRQDPKPTSGTDAVKPVVEEELGQQAAAAGAS